MKEKWEEKKKITITQFENGMTEVADLITGETVISLYRSAEELLQDLYIKIYGFKKGDRIKGTKECDNQYFITNSSFIGYVTESPDFSGKMKISRNIDDDGFIVDCKYFEKAECLNCRVVCTSSPNPAAVGRIFNVVDGIVKTMPGYVKFNDTPVCSIEELNSICISQFIAIKE